jgi:Ca2+-binding RTX toxin-like protein
MTKGLFAVAAIVAGAAALLVAAPAGAVVSCSYSSGTKTVTIAMTENNDFALVQRNGNAIQRGGVNCGSATVNNTDKIVVNGSLGRQTLTVYLGGGPFEPGATPEGSGTSEIEFQGSLQAGSDEIVVNGGSDPENVTAGMGGINLNGDGDADVTTAGIEVRAFSGGLGDDTLSAAGGLGTGLPIDGRVNLNGDDGDDTITGGEGPNGLFGGNDEDVITGGSDFDSISGGPGNDSIKAGEGNDQLFGDIGNDTIDGEGGDDTMTAGADPDGNDTYIGDGGADSISYFVRGTAPLNVSLDGVANDGRVATEFDNVMPDVEDVTGSKGPNVITGTSASNSLDGLDGSDTINGGPGFDSLSGDDGADIINGGDDDDSISGGAGADQLNGENGDDFLSGGTEGDSISGGQGGDFIFSAAVADGGDNLRGGSGRDTAFFNSRTGDLTIDEDGNADDGLTGEHDNVRPDIEEIQAGSGDDHISGSASDNSLIGGGGDDTVSGGAGDDSVQGSDGNDNLTGGDGEDFMFGQTGADHFHALDGGRDFIDGGIDADTDVVNDSDPLIDQINNIP